MAIFVTRFNLSKAEYQALTLLERDAIIAESNRQQKR